MDLNISLSSASMNAQNQVSKSSTALASGQTGNLTNALLAQQLTTEVTTQNAGAVNGRLAYQHFGTAGQALGQAQDIMSRLGELSTQATNSSLNADDRSVMQAEADALSAELSDMMNNQKFNGQATLSGGDFDTRVGSGLSLQNADLSGTIGALSGLDLNNPAVAQEQIADAQNQLNVEQAKVGAAQLRLGREITAATSAATNAQEAAASIGGVDIAREIGNMLQGMLQNQISSAVENTHNLSSQSVNRLLDGLKT